MLIGEGVFRSMLIFMFGSLFLNDAYRGGGLTSQFQHVSNKHRPNRNVKMSRCLDVQMPRRYNADLACVWRQDTCLSRNMQMHTTSTQRPSWAWWHLQSQSQHRLACANLLDYISTPPFGKHMHYVSKIDLLLWKSSKLNKVVHLIFSKLRVFMCF